MGGKTALKNLAGQLRSGLEPAGQVLGNVVLLVANSEILKVYPERRLLYYPDLTPGRYS